MEKLFGTYISVHFKDKNTFSGVLVDADDENIYIEADKIYIVPKTNVRYYSVEREKQEEAQSPTDISTNKSENILRVSVNSELVAKIPYPPNMDISSPNEEILRLVLANENVQLSLKGKVQQKLEYSPKEINIVANDYVEKKEEIIAPSISENNSFNMSGSIINNYVSPTEMAQRLQKIGKRKGEKNE